MRIILPIFACLCLLVTACNPYINKIKNNNIAFLYQIQEASNQPKIKVFRNHIDSVTIFGEFEPSLLFLPEKQLEPPVVIRFEVSLFLKYASKFAYFDSIILTTNDIKNDNDLHFAFVIPTKLQNYAVTKLIIRSNQGPKAIKLQFEINKGSFPTEQNSVLVTPLGKMKPNWIIEVGEEFYLKSIVNNITDSFFWVRISPHRYLPLPPFYNSDFRKPQITTDLRLPYSKSQPVKLFKEGVYILESDSSKPKTGVLVSCRKKGYPNITDATELLPPIRYITNQNEYDSLALQPDLGLAVNNFWLQNAGFDTFLAERMKNDFYSRVVYSNRFFEGIDQGWATDRGLIYIIYGPPSAIFKDFDRETWVYNRLIPNETIQFWFLRIENSFTQNYYILDRSPSYESHWYQVVQQWRQPSKIGTRP